MKGIAELTQHDGRRVGIPQGAAVLIVSFKEEQPDTPKAQTMVRWSANEMNGPTHSFLRDDLRALRNAFPLACGGAAWMELEAAAGDTLLVPEGSGTGGYNEEEDGVFSVTLVVPTGPITVRVRATIEDVRKLAGLEGAAPVAAEA